MTEHIFLYPSNKEEMVWLSFFLLLLLQVPRPKRGRDLVLQCPLWRVQETGSSWSDPGRGLGLALSSLWEGDLSSPGGEHAQQAGPGQGGGPGPGPAGGTVSKVRGEDPIKELGEIFAYPRFGNIFPPHHSKMMQVKLKISKGFLQHQMDEGKISTTKTYWNFIQTQHSWYTFNIVIMILEKSLSKMT